MEIKARRHLAVWYQCPQCKRREGSTMMTPTKRNRDYRPTCMYCDCEVEIMERRYYTTFASDFYSTAGTLGQFGPFNVCDIVHPNIRVFRKWVEMRRAELAEQSRKYMEEFNRMQAEGEARLKRRCEEAALLKEAERVAYRRMHAIELAAEQVARAVWPEEISSGWSLEKMKEEISELEDDHPF